LTDTDLIKLNQDFNNTLDIWIDALDRYDLKQLLTAPSSQSWSLGQVYVHIILETTFYLKQMMICASSEAFATEKMSDEGKEMFCNNAFPDAVLEGPPSNDHVTQPESKEYLRDRLINLKAEAGRLSVNLQASRSRGKTKHPGLHYLSGGEWLQFAEMHLRHHFRQKSRVDSFLKGLH
jgi:hypothetical protein